MGQHKAKMGATMRQPGSNSNPARADGSAFAGARLSGVSLINSAPPAPHEWLALRASQSGAPQAADPPTAGPEKHQPSFRRVGESFLAGIRVAHKRLQEYNPAPPRFEGT